MKKVLFLFAALTMSVALSSNAKIFEENHFTVNLNVGGYQGGGGAAFGLGAAFQTEVLTCDWLTLDWDVLHFQWSAPFNSPGDADNLSFKTGARAYSPTFANDHLRAYTNLDMGYVLALAKGLDDKIAASSAFGLTYGFGLQLNKKWSFGYTLEWESAGKSKGHFGTVAFTF